MRKINRKTSYDIYIRDTLFFISLIKYLVFLDKCSKVVSVFICTYPSTGAVRIEFFYFYFRGKEDY